MSLARDVVNFGSNAWVSLSLWLVISAADLEIRQQPYDMVLVVCYGFHVEYF